MFKYSKFHTKTISDILKSPTDYIDKDITITGRITKLKRQKKRVFGTVCDGSESVGLQFVLTLEESSKILEDCTIGSSVKVSGIIVESPARGQYIDMVLKDLILISKLEKSECYKYGSSMHKRKTEDEWQTRLIDIRKDTYGRYRDKVLQSIFRIRSKAITALTLFFDKQGFVKVDTPLITKSDCEGAGEMFQVTTLDLGKLKSSDVSDHRVDYSQDFFKSKSHLTVSGQLEAEALAQTLGKVWTFGPTFRAEDSHTHRHLAEFWMLEPELVLSDFSKLLDLEESMVRCCISYLLEECKKDFKHLEKTISPGLISKLISIRDHDFKRITYSEVIDILKDETVVFTDKPDTIYWGMDLSSECERYICEVYFDGSPVFVTSYPVELKSFYMKEDSVSGDESKCSDGSDRSTCQAVDLLVPGIGELCGGSMREDDPEKLISRMKEKSIPLDDLSWYVDLRKEGGLPTGGFGLGFERFVRLLTGAKHIRDVIPYPRYPGHI